MGRPPGARRRADAVPAVRSYLMSRGRGFMGGREAMARRRLFCESRVESACSTRVGIRWPRVVRTARRPHLPAVPPTLLQWRPTLVQCIQTTPAATTATGGAGRHGRVVRRRLGLWLLVLSRPDSRLTHAYREQGHGPGVGLVSLVSTCSQRHLSAALRHPSPPPDERSRTEHVPRRNY